MNKRLCFAILMFGPLADAHAASVIFAMNTTINADATIGVAETWTIEPGVTLTINAGVTVTNQGNLINKGIMESDGTLQNHGSVECFDHDGGAPFEGRLNSRGAIVNHLGAGINLHTRSVLSNAGGGVFNNSGTVWIGAPSTATLTNVSTFNNLPGAVIDIEGLGTLNNTSGGRLNNNSTAAIHIRNNGDLINGGGGIFENSGQINITLGGDLRNSPGFSSASFLNTGQVVNSGFVENASSFSNTGTFTILSGGSLNNKSPSGFFNNYNAGVIENQSGGTIDNTDWIANQFLSVIHNSGKLNSSGELSNAGGTITNYSGAEIINLAGGLLKNFTGSLVNQNGALLKNSGNLTTIEFGSVENMGTMSNESGGLFDSLGATSNDTSGVIDNYGDFYIRGANRSNVPTGMLDNYGTFNNQLTGALTVTFDTTAYQGGVLSNHPSGLVTNAGSVTIECGAILIQDGTVNGAPYDICIPQADLEINITDSTFDPVLAGTGQVSLGVILTNHGPNVAFNVMATLQLPPAFTYLGNNPGCQGSSSGQVVCTLTDALVISAGLALDLAVSLSASGAAFTTGLVTANEIDPVPANNEESEETTIIAVNEIYKDGFEDSE